MTSTSIFDNIASIYEDKFKNVSEFRLCRTGRSPQEFFAEFFEGKYSNFEVVAYSKVKYVASEFENYLLHRFGEMENFICETEVDEDNEPENPEKTVVIVVYNE